MLRVLLTNDLTPKSHCPGHWGTMGILFTKGGWLMAQNTHKTVKPGKWRRKTESMTV